MAHGRVTFYRMRNILRYALSRKAATRNHDACLYLFLLRVSKINNNKEQALRHSRFNFHQVNMAVTRRRSRSRSPAKAATQTRRRRRSTSKKAKATAALRQRSSRKATMKAVGGGRRGRAAVRRAVASRAVRRTAAAKVSRNIN